MCPSGVMFASQVMCASHVRMRNTSHHFATEEQYITMSAANSITSAKPIYHCLQTINFMIFEYFNGRLTEKEQPDVIVETIRLKQEFIKQFSLK